MKNEKRGKKRKKGKKEEKEKGKVLNFFVTLLLSFNKNVRNVNKSKERLNMSRKFWDVC